MTNKPDHPSSAGLGRHPDFDKRSRNFPIRQLLQVDRKPRSYTWNFWPNKKTPVLNQGTIGMCVGTSWTHECAIRPLATAKDLEFAQKKVYWEAQKIDPWNGGEYPGASPNYAGTSVLAGAKVMHRLGFFREYRWAFGIWDLIQTIGYHGPAVLGCNWYYEMYWPDRKGFIRPRGAIYGGHALVVAGINVSEKYFTLINSWGTGWGGGTGGLLPGWCRVTFADMEYLLEQDGEVCVPSTRRSEDFE